MFIKDLAEYPLIIAIRNILEKKNRIKTRGVVGSTVKPYTKYSKSAKPSRAVPTATVRVDDF